MTEQQWVIRMQLGSSRIKQRPLARQTSASHLVCMAYPKAVFIPPTNGASSLAQVIIFIPEIDSGLNQKRN